MTNLVNLPGGFLQFSWPSETGRTYQVQISSNLVNWSDVGNSQSGRDQSLSATFQVGPAQQFFRMRIY